MFASELSALLAHGGVDRELSIEGLASYFFSDYVHPPATIVRKARKLPPGHTIVWQDGNFGLPHAYWQMPAPGPAPAKPDARAGGRAVVEPRPRRLVAAGVRRAGRHLPVGRHRFVVRRDGGRRGGRAHEGVLDRLRGRHLRRVEIRAHDGGAARRRMDLGDAARTQPARRAGRRARPHRRAAGRSVVPADVPAVAAGRPPRQGGRRRRRRRRAVGRLPDVPRAPHGGGLPARPRLDPQATSSAASSGGCRSTIATRAWSGSCAGSRSAGTTTW